LGKRAAMNWPLAGFRKGRRSGIRLDARWTGRHVSTRCTRTGQKGFRMSGSNPLNRALQILEVVASARRGISLVQIVNITGLPQSSTFRLVSNLVESEMLNFDADRKLYLAGSRTQRLALLLQGNEELEIVVGPMIAALSRDLEETTFYVRKGTEGLRLLKYVVPEIVGRTFIHPGFEFPPNATASGKVVYAFSHAPEDPDFGILKEMHLAPTAVKDLEDLRRMFTTVRNQGYAFNIDEFEPGIASVAVPVFQNQSVIGALSIILTSDRLPPDGSSERERVLACLTAASRNLSAVFSAQLISASDPLIIRNSTSP
jgi:DNA-binding IclR family transcriptional regulator